MLMLMKTIIEKQDEEINMLKKILQCVVPHQEDFKDVLPRKWETEGELESACMKTDTEKSYRKALVRPKS